MFELTNNILKYDLLDDMDRISSNSVVKVVDESDERLSPGDFYHQFFRGGYTHLFTVTVLSGEGQLSIEKTRERLQALRYRYFGDFDLDVQVVGTKSPYRTGYKPLYQLNKEFLIDDSFSGFPCIVMFKIPIRLDDDYKSFRRRIFNLMNFMAILHTISLYADSQYKAYVFHPRDMEYNGKNVHVLSEATPLPTDYCHSIKFGNTAIQKLIEQYMDANPISTLFYRIYDDYTKDILEMDAYRREWYEHYLKRK